MFAVPGWAVSADNLKPEAAVASNTAQDESAQSKKRKRPSSGPANVTESNVADLWERVIEGRSGKKAKPSNDQGDGGSGSNPGDKPGKGLKKMTLKEKKKLKKLREKEANQNSVDGAKPVNDGSSKPTSGSSDATAETGVKKDKKKKKQPSEHQKEEPSNRSKARDEKGPANQPSKPQAPAAPKLTPLQAAMREKLVSARFRHLNETLYTKPSADSFRLFEDAPEMFQEYHEGFRRQVEVWPENPVAGYIADIQARGRARGAPRSKTAARHGHPPSEEGDAAAAPLPRTNGVCTVADLGCGDAKLAEALRPAQKKLRVEVLSFDLQSPHALVTRADIADLPLADGAVDVAVFCLALMGTNWLDFVEEAYRVLRWKGELWVAEIKSRFGAGAGAGAKGKAKPGAPVAHSVGNRRKSSLGDTKKKGKKGRDGGEDDEVDEAALAVEVDGADDKREETDVSAFVEALRKRGFVLQGAADLRNKMFVKMRFLKAASPTVGKGVIALKESSRGTGPKKQGVKFIEAEGDQTTADESSILKPCVYKLR